MEFECDLNCPARDEVRHCCKSCYLARRDFLEAHPELKNYWDDKAGFWASGGCRIPRKQRPTECNEYDCKNCIFVVVKYYSREENRWIESASVRVPEKARNSVIGGVMFYPPEMAEEIYRKHNYGANR